MCKCKQGGFNFVFHELSRKEKPCLNLRNQEDAKLLADALTFAKDHCINVDACCSSRIYTRLADMQDLMNADEVKSPVLKALKAGLVCPVEEKEEYCCDNIAADTVREGSSGGFVGVTW